MSAPRASVARSAVGIIGSTIVTLAIGYVASIVLARSLGPAGRGLVAVIQPGAVLRVRLVGLAPGPGWGVPGGLVATGMISLVRIAGCLRLVAQIGVRLPSAHLRAATLRYGSRVTMGQLCRFFSGRFDVLVLSLMASLTTVG